MKNNILKTISYSLVAFMAFIAVLGFSGKAFASEMVILSTSNPTDTTVTVSAMVTNSVNDTAVRGSFQYATNPSFVSADYTNETIVNLASTKTFSQTITGLTPGTTYYVRALGIGDKDGVAKYSSTLTFKTSSATVTTSPNTAMLTANTNGTTAINVSMHYNLGSASTGSAWFEYGTSNGSYPNKTNAISVTNTNGTYSETISGLSVNTTYYVRAVVQTSASTAYSNSTLMVKTNNVNNNGGGNTNYVYGCMRTTDRNYNPLANQHTESMCGGDFNNNWFNGWFNGGNQNCPTTCVNNNNTNTNTNTNTNGGAYTDPNDLKKVSGTTAKTSTSAKTSTVVKNANAKITEKDYDANKYLASAFWGVGDGFFPTTLVGWLLLIFLILMLIVLTRHYFNKPVKPEVKKV